MIHATRAWIQALLKCLLTSLPFLKCKKHYNGWQDNVCTFKQDSPQTSFVFWVGSAIIDHQIVLTAFALFSTVINDLSHKSAISGPPEMSSDRSAISGKKTKRAVIAKRNAGEQRKRGGQCQALPRANGCIKVSTKKPPIGFQGFPFFSGKKRKKKEVEAAIKGPETRK